MKEEDRHTDWASCPCRFWVRVTSNRACRHIQPFCIHPSVLASLSSFIPSTHSPHHPTSPHTAMIILEYSNRIIEDTLQARFNP